MTVVKTGIDDVISPQPVAAPLTRSAIFLVVTINPGPDHRSTVRSFCADLPALFRAVEFRNLEAGLTCVMGIGSEAWDRLFSQPSAGRAAPVPGNTSGVSPCGIVARRSLVSYSRETPGSLLRTCDKDHG